MGKSNFKLSNLKLLSRVLHSLTDFQTNLKYFRPLPFTIFSGEAIFSSKFSENILENFRVINGMVIFDLKSVQKSDFKAEIFDLSGKIIFQKNYKHNLEATQNIDIQSFKNGIYLLKISTEIQRITQKFVLNQ